jgi:hypothetical protein
MDDGRTDGWTQPKFIALAHNLLNFSKEKNPALITTEYFVFYFKLKPNRGSSVSVVTRLQACRTGFRFPIVVKKFLPLPSDTGCCLIYTVVLYVSSDTGCCLIYAVVLYLLSDTGCCILYTVVLYLSSDTGCCLL